MNCFFDPEDNFKLTISASFKSMNRHPDITDERKFTMITGEVWENFNNYDRDEWVTIFETSSCIGDEQDGVVKFEGMALKRTRNSNKKFLILITKYFLRPSRYKIAQNVLLIQ